MAYEKNTSMDSNGDMHVLDTLESLAAKIGVASRQAQRALRGRIDDPVRAVFGIADHLVANLGKCISGDLVALEASVPLMVPLILFDKVAINLESLKAHRHACLLSGRSVHYAQHANLANREVPMNLSCIDACE